MCYVIISSQLSFTGDHVLLFSFKSVRLVVMYVWISFSLKF